MQIPWLSAGAASCALPRQDDSDGDGVLTQPVEKEEEEGQEDQQQEQDRCAPNNVAL
jgi:hypothetical protein